MKAPAAHRNRLAITAGQVAPEGRGYLKQRRVDMRIEIVTMWYNEEFLAPFFLNHYHYVDKIHLLLDVDTTDATARICAGYPNVAIEPFRFPDMMDDLIKSEKITSVYRRLNCDWVYLVDCDEFLFPPSLGSDPRQFLEAETQSELIVAQMWQVYRHRTDADLDPRLPTILQRRHGDPNVTTGVNAEYCKPIVVRSGLDIRWSPGCHMFASPQPIHFSARRFLGAHWSMADPAFAVQRRIAGRKQRQSQRNLRGGMSKHDHHITAEQIMRRCEEHRDDPQLF
jgi:hypothetical protein